MVTEDAESRLAAAVASEALLGRPGPRFMVASGVGLLEDDVFVDAEEASAVCGQFWRFNQDSISFRVLVKLTRTTCVCLDGASSSRHGGTS